eukprot:gnl/TRDRNA2_/TRDRNA2_94923_c0_seq1.p1 gnl/TRDRNA2_/TRDRNA2_94923_c0~~gnl/TRDRNA2_/TRDRNA2_94923_c0_seq1.p1  ORF type:complete len:252 (-),score=58.45 gnl/TRDRNA2_/TRDRNA2_94923_c0_seq1:125-880(-)
MNRGPYHEYLSSQSISQEATISLAGRVLPADLEQQVSNLTMGQLMFMMSHIQKLSSQAPHTAQKVLAENPQLCYALLHAECLAGMVEEPMLPMSAEELRKSKLKMRQLEEIFVDYVPPAPGSQQATQPKAFGGNAFGGNSKALGVPVNGTTTAKYMPAPKGPPSKAAPSGAQFAAPGQAPHAPSASGSGGTYAKSFQAPPMSADPAAMDPGQEEERQTLLRRLMTLTPEQIERLGDDTKRQVLEFLQQQSA